MTKSLLSIQSRFLAQKQSLPLVAKIRMTQSRIQAWNSHFNGNIYIAFSGGRDSTVLMDIVRGLYPNTPALFCDTGLEYPEVRNFVKGFENVTWARPKMNYQQVIQKYGYPVISKEQSTYIYKLRRTNSEKFRSVLLSKGRFSISLKWRYMIDAPFEVSGLCCDVMKKNISHAYSRATGRYAIVGTMAEDSRIRQRRYLQVGSCNGFNLKNPVSTPLAFWGKDDILAYIKERDLPISPIYDIDGIDHTGCMYCLFGLHFEPEGKNRFDLMKVYHRKLYDFCMNKLGIARVMEYYLHPTEAMIETGKKKYQRTPN